MRTSLPLALAIRRLGGTARWADVAPLVSRREARRAIENGEVRRLARGRYGLTEIASARDVAAQVGGTVSHLSAAQEHRLPLLVAPERVAVTVRPNAHPLARDQVQVYWRVLAATDVRDGVTTVVRTVLDCAAELPLPEALAIADGALRLGLVTPTELHEAARRWRGRGAGRVRHVAAHADARAANPFESALRALALGAGCTGFLPQVEIDVPGDARVDLADVERRVVLEADSFEWHGSRGALRRDCRRYDELVRAGWTVLRFAWEDVMFDQDWVSEVIRDVAAARPPHPKGNRR